MGRPRPRCVSAENMTVVTLRDCAEELENCSRTEGAQGVGWHTPHIKYGQNGKL